MTDPHAQALADLSYAEMCRVITRNAGGSVLDCDGVTYWRGTHPSPAIVNGLFRTSENGPSAAAVLDQATVWFEEVGHQFAVHARLGRDEDLEAAALERGFVLLFDLPVMVYTEPSPPAPEVHDGYTLERVETPAQVMDFVAAVGEPMELPDEARNVFSRPASILSPFLAAALVRDSAGHPVAGAWTSVSHGAAAIGWVGTHEAHRGLGLGTAATSAAMQAGYGMGASWAVLQASPMGRSVYARMGFRELGAYRLLVPATFGHSA